MPRESEAGQDRVDRGPAARLDFAPLGHLVMMD
jgi:hypothetical protein